MRHVADWLARTAMLVLAALATLALIGSLASVSNSRIGGAFPGEIAAAPSAPLPAASDPQVVAPGTGTMTIESPVPAPAPPAPPTARETEIARWLKALTYAVIALAAIAAAGVVALLRLAPR
ncbi:MAG: hypothetical protein V4537_16925 [Pseudomonadota bacterium]